MLNFNIITKHPMQEMIAKELLNSPDAWEKIQNLTKGLDKTSTECVYRIISRVQNALLSQDGSFGNLSADESAKLEKICFEFYPNIFMLTPSRYYYDGYFLPIKHFEVGVFWDKHSMNTFDQTTLTNIKNKDIIDVGGFIGDSALIFREFTKEKIHTFEATSKNFELMQKTLQMNESSQIIPNKLALGSAKGSMRINLAGSASSAMYSYNNGEYEDVSVITLDEYVRENNLKIGFIKVDIEGGEMDFLRGALETIKIQRPAMLISIYHHPEQFFGIKPFIESLDLGYNFKIHKPVDNTISIETALYCEILN